MQNLIVNFFGRDSRIEIEGVDERKIELAFENSIIHLRRKAIAKNKTNAGMARAEIGEQWNYQVVSELNGHAERDSPGENLVSTLQLAQNLLDAVKRLGAFLK